MFNNTSEVFPRASNRARLNLEEKKLLTPQFLGRDGLKMTSGENSGKEKVHHSHLQVKISNLVIIIVLGIAV